MNRAVKRYFRNELRRRVVRARFGHRQVFLDNNILGRLINNHPTAVAFTRRFEHDLISRGMSGGKNIAPFVGPYSIFEILGLRKAMPNLSDHAQVANRKIGGESNLEQIKELIYLHYFDTCKDDPRLQISALNQELARRRASASNSGLVFLDAIQKQFLAGANSFAETLWRTLAIDRMYGHRYPDHLHHDISVSFITDLLRNMSEGHHFNQCRGVQLSFKNMATDAHVERLAASSGVPATNIQETLSQIVEDIRFGDNKDFVDTALVQMSTCGIHRRGWLDSILCMTCDRKDQVVKRVAAYKAALKFISDEARELNKTRRVPFKIIKPRHGTIVFVTDQGEIREHVNVADVPDILNLYTEETQSVEA